MRLLVKFSVIFTLVFGIGIAIAGFLTYRRLQDDARIEVRDQSRSNAASASKLGQAL